MGDDLTSDNVVDLDLNLEPLDQPVGALSGFGAFVNQLETAHGRIFERIRQLESVTARARQRQNRQRARYPVYDGDGLVEPGFDRGGSIRTDGVGVIERSPEKGKRCKRESMHLVAKALEMDLEVKKVDKEGGSFYDCNICFEMAKDPILTCCGHLYCWICFFKLPYVDSTAKECPVCKGEVIDTNIIPIYGSSDNTHPSEEESTLMVPPRPKAQRVESVRQQRVIRGLSHIPVAEALRRIRTSIGAIGDQLQEIPHGENIIQDAAVQESQVINTSNVLRLRSHQFSRVLSESAASLSTISSALDNAERDAAVLQSERPTLNAAAIASSSRTHDVLHVVEPLEGTTGIVPETNLLEVHFSSPSRRRRGSRLSDVDRDNIRHARRRRRL